VEVAQSGIDIGKVNPRRTRRDIPLQVRKGTFEQDPRFAGLSHVEEEMAEVGLDGGHHPGVSDLLETLQGLADRPLGGVGPSHQTLQFADGEQGSGRGVWRGDLAVRVVKLDDPAARPDGRIPVAGEGL
jgi:hypothetical protein